MDPDTLENTGLPDGPTELPDDPAGLEPTPAAAAGESGGDDRPAPEPAYKYDPRNAIYARRSEVLAADLAASGEVFDEARQAGRGISDPPAQPAVLAKDDDFVTIKVYGEERQAPRVEVERAGGVAAYQKAVAADVKLQRAAEAEARVRAEEQRLLRVAENLRQGLDENGQPLVAARLPAQGVPASTISKEALESTVKALYSGDAEEATSALATLVNQISSRQNTADPVSPDIVRAVEERVLERIDTRETQRSAERDVAEANRIFRENFKDIANDPDMMLWAKGIASQLAADPEHQGKSRAEIAELTGQRIRAKLGRPTTTDPLTQRRELKKTLTRPATGTVRAKAPAPPAPPTNAEYIQQLRRNSGSNSAPR